MSPRKRSPRINSKLRDKRKGKRPLPSETQKSSERQSSLKKSCVDMDYFKEYIRKRDREYKELRKRLMSAKKK